MDATDGAVSGDDRFSLTGCGPLDRLQARLGVVRADSAHLVRRAVFAALFAWLPLLAMALILPREGVAVTVDFFHDIAAHVRFLLVVPLLVMAEGIIGPRTTLAASGFMVSGVVRSDDVPQLRSAIHTTRKLVDSSLAEVALLATTFAYVLIAIRTLTTDDVVFWFEDPVAGGAHLSPAGWWYAIVAVPIAVFMFLRWAWRYVVWAWFLRRVSRLDLRLTGTHPDRVGGLGFVSLGQTAFAMVTFASGCVLAAAIGNRLLYVGGHLKEFQAAIIGFAVLSVVIGVAPLLVFSRRLVQTKRAGRVQYGRLASHYVDDFERKWIGGGAPPGEVMLGSSDFQSLADLGGSFERLIGMRPVVFDRRTLLVFAVAALTPMLPLLLTVMPLRDIVKLLLKSMV